MTIGPVQLLVLGFARPDFQGEIRKELQLLRDNDLVRVIDVLAVRKNAEGAVSVLRESQLSEDEAAEFGAVVGALIGLGTELGTATRGSVGDGVAVGAELGAEMMLEHGGVFSDDEAWDVLTEIPEDFAAALILLEHRWAIPLRDAVARAGGFRLASEFISPFDLVAVGLLTAEAADAMAATEGYPV